MKFLALDSLRGIAASLVVLVHLTAAGYFYDVAFVRHGAMAVPLFFILSGFVIAHAYGSRLNSLSDARSFMIRRFGRLYPLHFATLAVLVMLELVKLLLTSRGVSSGTLPFTDANSLPTLVANIFLLHAVIPFGVYSWNGPSWSISTEFWTYCAFAIVVLLSGRLRVAAVIAAAVGLGATLVCLPYFGIHLKDMTGLGMLMCLFCFLLGEITYRLFRLAKSHELRIPAIMEFAIVPIAVVPFWTILPYEVISPLIFAVVIFVFANEVGPISRWLKAEALQFLGKISYSIYMIHFIVLAILNGVLRTLQSVADIPLLGPNDMISFGPPGTMDLLALVYFAVVVGLGTLSYHFIEAPFRDFFNALAGGKSLASAWNAAVNGRASEPAIPQAVPPTPAADH